MKTDHTFTFTAAVVLAGVVLAFISPADATEKASPIASIAVAPVSAFAAADSNGASVLKHDARHKRACDGARHSERPTNS